MQFALEAPFQPAGGQEEAIRKLAEGYAKFPRQTLLGITGSGKTFVMANVIQRVQKPTLILAHNKTLAAQLYAELREYFPHNRVEYFISYYDYYQPESYLPTTDTYIEKDAEVNAQIEKMRMKATTALLSRSDVIIVASISCIYSLGDPKDFRELSLDVKKGQSMKRQQLLARLVEMQYARNDASLEPGTFRARGDVVDIQPPYDDSLVRVELFGDTVERVQQVHGITGDVIANLDALSIFPAKQFVVPEEKQKRALAQIRDELKERVAQLAPLEAQRLAQRVKYDLEMIRELGYCSGIENYSRHFDGRKPGEPPYVLLDYFPRDFLLIIDESHQTIPQAHAMNHGDHSRKKSLIDFGFRLPSAYDNRPLTFNVFEKFLNHVIFVSATPAEYETKSSGQVVELIIRPTGLLDPLVAVRPITGHVQDLMKEIRETVKRGERVLVTTLTKRMAEDLTDYLAREDIRARYMHSEIQSLDRIELIRQLRAGEFDVLVGINLLREGLDLPEVSLVAILDADKEGFLRNERSLIQTIGRAARNEHGHVIMYADRTTDSMRAAISITEARREAQARFNKEHGITPKTIIKAIAEKKRELKGVKHLSKTDVKKKLVELESEMRVAAEKLDFERAIELRDALREMAQYA